MVDVSDSVTTLRGAFIALVEMDTAWMKMDASAMVKSWGNDMDDIFVQQLSQLSNIANHWVSIKVARSPDLCVVGDIRSLLPLKLFCCLGQTSK